MSVVTQSLTTFTLTSPNTATAPFVVGHAFKQGDVPSGSGVVVTGGQATVMNAWPDGSAKFAVLAGTASLTANTPLAITVGSGVASGGTVLTTANLKTAMSGQTCSIACGAFGTVLWATTDFDSPFETWVSGHEMSSWRYRKAVGSDAHLVGWIEVRLFASGAVEVLPWIENAYLFVSGPNTKSATFTFSLGSTDRYSGALDIAHHTRIPLLDGVFSHWLGTDPAVVPKHNVQYLVDTKMVPRYGWTAPSSTALDALTQAYTPNYIGDVDASMGNAGTHPALLQHGATLYVTSGDARAYRNTIANGYAGGSWSIHYRDEGTNEPFLFSDYPSVTDQGGSTPALPTESGTPNGYYYITHHPSFAYLPYLLTGRQWFLEELIITNTFHYLHSDSIRRYGSDGVYMTGNGTYTERGAGWAYRTMAQALAVCPSTHSMYPGLVNQVEQNFIRPKGFYVDGALYSDQYVSNVNISNSLGQTAPYADYNADNSHGSGFWTSPWMNCFVVESVGYAWDLNLPISSTAKTAHQAWRDWLYKYPVGLAGDGTTGFNYRWFPAYEIPMRSDKTTYYTTWAQVAAEWAAHTPEGTPPAGTAEGLSLWYGVDVGAGDFTNAFLGQKLPALAYAKAHGAAGADDAWRRITGSSSWPLTVAFNDTPELGIFPRNVEVVPAWRAGLSVNQAVELTSASPSALGKTNFTGDNGGSWIDSWCGLSIDTRSSKVYSFANGGHEDYWGNEINALNLAADTPTWANVLPISTGLSGLVSASNVPYYPDGRPASVHSYYQQQFIEARNRAARFPTGALARSGNGNRACASYAILTNTCDAQGTYIPDCPPVSAATAGAICKISDLRTGVEAGSEDIYFFYENNAVYKWQQSSNTWSTLTLPAYPPGFIWGYTASCYDPVRNRILLWGTGAASFFNLSDNSFTSVTPSGDSAACLFDTVGLVYEPVLDQFIVKTGYSSAETTKTKFYAVAPTDLTTAEMTVTGNSGIPSPATISGGIQNVYNKFLYVPALSGVVYVPSYAANGWFMRTH